MNIYECKTMGERIAGNPYVGRGIVIGKTEDGKKAAVAYFIMGRSENSRNRVFSLRDNALFTEPYDASKVEDPSLIIYAALRRHENRLIVTNGDQTDTVFEGLKNGRGFSCSLRTREFEPDAPNFTPRISGMLTFADGDFAYDMSILSPAFTARHEKRIINVHPSLIPSFCGKGFYGLRVHEAALAYGVKVTGATVHFVNEVPDGGEIILQRAVSVKEGDTPEILQRRVMEEAEWIILPRATEKVCASIASKKENNK